MDNRGKHRRSPHLSADQIELFVLRRMEPAEHQLLATHIADCRACQERIARETLLVSDIRRALRAEVWRRRHLTGDGEITLTVSHVDSVFLARITGPEIDGGKVLATGPDARNWCEMAFADMFPEHACGPGCA